MGVNVKYRTLWFLEIQAKSSVTKNGSLASMYKYKSTYVGIIFQYNNKFTKAEKQLSNQGRKAMFGLRKTIIGMLLNH